MKNILVNAVNTIVPAGADEVGRVMMSDCNKTDYSNGQADLDRLRLSGICSKRLPWRRLFFSIKKIGNE